MPYHDLIISNGAMDFRGNPEKRSETGSWKACTFILVHLFFERIAFYGISNNLVVYFKNRIKQSSSKASNSVTNWSGTCFITPMIGAFIADSYMGRYWTTTFSLIVYFLATILLALAASIPGLKPENGEVTEMQTLVSFIALYLIAFGSGSIRPCVLPFGADQFDANETKSRSSYFNWNYFSSNFGIMVALTAVIWVQLNVNWKWGFGVPAILIGLATVSFVSGTRFYRYQTPNRNPVTQICKVFVASLRKWKVHVPEDVKYLHETIGSEPGIKKLQHTKSLSFFDKAAVVMEEDNTEISGDPWRLCNVTEVEETKAIIRLLPIWATGITFSCIYCQMQNFFVLQGLKMDARIGNSNFIIPAASMGIFNASVVVFWTPIYDRCVVPITRMFTGKNNGLTQLQRIGIGLFISSIGMLYAGILEFIRLKYVQRHGYYHLESIPMSIFWQIPQYFIIGWAEVFVMIGRSEFFYDQAPNSMRSLCSALDLLTLALGNFMSTFIVTIVSRITTSGGKLGWIPDNLNRGHLDYYFYMLALLSMLNLGAFLFLSSSYTYKSFDG